LPTQSRFFWQALAAFWCALALSWTLGAWLQLKNLPGGLLLTEVLFFALPALVVLRRQRGCVSWEPFARPATRVLPWVVFIALCTVGVAVAKGLAVRQSLGLSIPDQTVSFGLLLLMATFPPLCEELVMRPVLQRAFALYWSPRNSVLAAALLFALLHSSWLRFGETFILGLFGGILFLKTGNYWVCVLFHAVSNAAGPLLFRHAGGIAWLLNPAASILLVVAASLALWRITPAPTAPLTGLRGRLNWVFFGGAAAAARFAKKRAMAAAFWASAGCLMLVLSAALPLELKMYPTPLLDAQGAVTPEQSESQSLAFVPTGEELILNLRADTQRGTITFAVHAPDGRLIGKQTGGGMTVGGWRLRAAGPGTHTLRVTPHEAAGRWQVHVSQR
jgi:membrane protease YdiL (CAAX protease family)